MENKRLLFANKNLLFGISRLYMEIIEVGDAANLFGGEVEEGETIAAEVGPVVVHLEGVTDTFPLFAVETVGEGGLVGTVAEVGLKAQIDLFE